MNIKFRGNDKYLFNYNLCATDFTFFENSNKDILSICIRAKKK